MFEVGLLDCLDLLGQLDFIFTRRGNIRGILIRENDFSQI